jgi:hypothetical protein
MLTSEWDFRRLAFEEIQKQSRAKMVELAGSLAEDVKLSDYARWGKPGLRAQLLDLETGRLVNDFLWERDDRSLHILNAVSPGFTCCLPFADLICDQIEKTAGS